VCIHCVLFLHRKCIDFHKIFRECLGGYRYFIGGKVKHFATDDVVLTSYFRVCKLWVLTLKTCIWWNVKIALVDHCVDRTQKYANPLHNFCIVNCFCGLSFWLSARSSTLLMLADVHTLHHCMDDLLPAICWTAWYCHSCQFCYLKLHSINIQLSDHFPETSCTNLQLLTLADSQTFFIKCLSSTVKPIIHKHKNMMSAWLHW